MRLLSVFLTATAFLTGANGVALELSGQVRTQYHSTDEERVKLPDNILGLSKIVELAMKTNPSTQNMAYELFLKARTNPAKVFTLLNLNVAGVRLKDNPRLLQWLGYVYKYRNPKKGQLFSDRQIFVLLLPDKTPVPVEANMALLFQSLEKTSEYKKLSKSLLDRLFDNWYTNKVVPERIKSLYRITDTTPSTDLRAKIYADYANMVFIRAARAKLFDDVFGKYAIKGGFAR